VTDPTGIGGPVLVVGSGLIGASVALALGRAGAEVLLRDARAENLAVAVAAGAGRPVEADDAPVLVVVAVPPRWAPQVLADVSAEFADATITDTTSVKESVLAEAVARGADPQRLVGGHPMAGREVSGPAGARADLLDDRLWVLTPLPQSGVEHVRQAHRLVSACGAYPVEMGMAEHDAAVALVSHTPQVLASVLAGQLVGSDPERVRIAGQGLRDMTRIAGSNPALWTEILEANAAHVAQVLDQVIADLGRTADALRARAAGDGSGGGGDAGGDAGTDAGADPVAEMLANGNAGQQLIPGKHGAASAAYREISVMLADRPGELGRLFAVTAESDISVEDVRIEHVLGRPSGLVALFVRPESGEDLAWALTERGFDVRA
jgi:prephenate dehydrogenase